MQYAHLIPSSFASAIRSWLQEDIPGFDYVGAVVGAQQESATLFAKSETVVCGYPFFDMVMEEVGCKVEWHVPDGTRVKGNDKSRIAVATVTGPAKQIMLGERLALNIISQASGIAMRCRRMTELAEANGFEGVVAATRKVTPGFRVVQKYAVIVGGCDAHRMDLSSMCMLKDNAIESCGGSIANAVQAAKKLTGFSLKVEVECRNEAEALEAVGTNVDIIMLDNFAPEEVHPLAAKLKSIRSTVTIEVSGGITDATIPSFMGPDIDVISTSSLILGVPVADYSLKVLH